MQIGELWVKIGGKNESFKASMTNAEEAAKKAAERLEQSSTALLKTVTVAATAAAAAVTAIGVKAVEAAANSRAMNAQFEQVFGAVQKDAQATIESLGNTFGMLPNRLKGPFSTTTSMFKGLGYDTAEAMGMAEDAVTLAADAAAFFDKSYEDANGALTSFIKGNYEGGESIGLFGNETQIAAYASDKLGISWKDAGEAQKQLARLEYAKAMQEAAGATGQAARESDEYQNQLGNLKQGWIDFLAVIGIPLLEPVVNALKGLTEHLSTFRDLVTDEGLAGAIEKIIPDWLEGAIFAVAGAITVAIIPALIGMATAAWAAIVPLAPFLAAGAAIGALAYVIIRNWEPIKGFFLNLWTGVVDKWNGFKDAVLNLWDSIKKSTSEKWEAIKQYLVDWWPYLLGALLGPIGLLVAAIYNNWDAIKQSTIEIWTTIQTWLYELWEGIKTQVAKAWDSIYKTLTNVWDMIKTGFNNLVDSAKNWGRNLIQNLIDGIRDRFEALRDIVSDMASMVSDYLGFSSPTKEGPGRFADRWAPNLVNMFADGIRKSMPRLQVSLSDMAAVMPPALGPSIINNSTSNNDSGNIFHIHVTGGSTREQAEGIMRELHRLGVRF